MKSQSGNVKMKLKNVGVGRSIQKHNFGLLDMYKKKGSEFFDLDIENPLGRGSLAEFRPTLLLLPHGPFTVKLREIGDPSQRPPNFVAFETFVARPQGRLRSRERLLAQHTSGPRDVPRCGALSLLQKTPHYRGGSSRNRC
jgi:hypothetical protein